MVATDTRSVFARETVRTYKVRGTRTIKAHVAVATPVLIKGKYRVTVEVDALEDLKSIRDAASVHLIVAE